MMSACVKGGRYQAAVDMFHQMKEESLVKPTVITYCVLIFAFGKLHKLALALDAFNDLKTCGLVPTVDSYNAMMLACNLCDRPDLVIGLFKDMQAASLIPDEFTHTAQIPAEKYRNEKAAQDLQNMHMNAFRHFSKMKLLWD